MFYIEQFELSWFYLRIGIHDILEGFVPFYLPFLVLWWELSIFFALLRSTVSLWMVSSFPTWVSLATFSFLWAPLLNWIFFTISGAHACCFLEMPPDFLVGTHLDAAEKDFCIVWRTSSAVSLWVNLRIWGCLSSFFWYSLTSVFPRWLYGSFCMLTCFNCFNRTFD